MPAKRAIVFFILVAGLVVLTIQNLSPAISLVFFGVQSLTLPLSVWLLIAIAGGVLTSIIISSLFQVSPQTSYKKVAKPKPPIKPSQSPQDSASVMEDKPESFPEITNKPSQGNGDDWETEVRKVGSSWNDDDNRDWEQSSPPSPVKPSNKPSDKPSESESWDERTENPLNSPNTNENWQKSPSQNQEIAPNATPPEPLSKNYEVEQEPQKQSWSGSVYSFNYKDGNDSGVGRPESVYDADYRLINPPSPPTQIQSDDEDWGFNDDDED